MSDDVLRAAFEKELARRLAVNLADALDKVGGEYPLVEVSVAWHQGEAIISAQCCDGNHPEMGYFAEYRAMLGHSRQQAYEWVQAAADDVTEQLRRDQALRFETSRRISLRTGN
jgi:hypothetical protein